MSQIDSVRRLLYFLVAGFAWAVVAYLFGAKSLGAHVWGGILASPLIAVAVGLITQARFESSSGLRRSLVALGSLYVGATMFGLAVGIHDLTTGHGSREALEVLLQGPLAVLWGITFTGFFILFWPLAYFTHYLIELFESR